MVGRLDVEFQSEGATVRAWSRSIGQWRSRQAWCSRSRHTVLPRTDIPRPA